MNTVKVKFYSFKKQSTEESYYANYLAAAVFCRQACECLNIRNWDGHNGGGEEYGFRFTIE